MVKGFRPTLEPPAHRQVNTSARPLLCFIICAVVAALVFSGFAASGWSFYNNRFDENKEYFAPGDEVAVSEVTSDFSSVFCQSYQVKLSKPGQVYLLPSSAEVNKSLIGPGEAISMVQVPGFPYSKRRLYLLDQSEMSLTACRQNGSRDLSAQILLIKGTENLRSWRRDTRCRSCVERRVHVPLSAQCPDEDESGPGGSHEESEKFIGEEDLPQSAGTGAHSVHKGLAIEEKDNPFVQVENQSLHETKKVRQKSARASKLSKRKRKHTTFHHTVSGTDKYFIIIFYGNPQRPNSLFLRTGIKLTGTVRRTRYNVKDAKEVCVVSGKKSHLQTQTGLKNSSSANTCHFDLPWLSKMDVVVHFGGTQETFPNYADVITSCHVRLSVWICLFGVFPVALVLIMSVVSGVILCRRRPKPITAKWKKSPRHKKKHRAKHGDGKDELVDAEVLPEGSDGSMAIQGD